MKLRHCYKCSHWQKMLKSRWCNDYCRHFNRGMIVLHLTLLTTLQNKLWLITQWRRQISSKTNTEIHSDWVGGGGLGTELRCWNQFLKSCVANTDRCCWIWWRLSLNQTLVCTHVQCVVAVVQRSTSNWNLGSTAWQRCFKIVPLCGAALINDMMMMMNPCVTTVQWIKWSHTPLPVITPLDHGSWLQERKHQT